MRPRVRPARAANHPEADIRAADYDDRGAAQLRETVRTGRGCARRCGATGPATAMHARAAGITALFAGPSGTGKTLAAEVMAGRARARPVPHRPVGGREQVHRRDREEPRPVFSAAAEDANAVLFFDEADALFGKRSEVQGRARPLRQHRDRLPAAADGAVRRRRDPRHQPQAEPRRGLRPAARPSASTSRSRKPPSAAACGTRSGRRVAPRAEDVDLDWFAREYRLSGGNIRNTVLAAAHLAAADGQVVSREHLLHATRREYQKLGKNIPHPGPVAQRLAS